MDKKEILNRLLSKKGKNYTYTVVFFLIFSFLIFFVIRPNVLSVFEANLKITNLKKSNILYETQIQKVIHSQSLLVGARNDLRLLDEAVTKKPQVNELIANITDTAAKNKLTINKMSLINFNLKNALHNDQLNTVIFEIGLGGNFTNYLEFVKNLYNQRRLKLIQNININNVTQSGTPSGELIINFQLEGYYL